jgi:hypothetical protein
MWRCCAASDGLSLRELFVDASRPGFLAGGSLERKRLQALYDRLERLPHEQARALLGRLRDCCAAVWGGGAALSDELHAVEVGPF